MQIEACIHCDTLETMTKSVRAAFDGGAARLELCADMAADGLTPPRELIIAAREHFKRPGVLVMIRPRGGDFCYTESELREMGEQIDMAAECGADGVVFGVLTETNELAMSPLSKLIKQCKKLNVQISFHRAFDATPDKFETLGALINLGVDRILTSGTEWGNGRGALDGIDRLSKLIEHAADRVEIVIGGGISVPNAPAVINQLPAQRKRVSLHAYSGIRSDGVTDVELVAALVNAAATIES